MASNSYTNRNLIYEISFKYQLLMMRELKSGCIPLKSEIYTTCPWDVLTRNPKNNQEIEKGEKIPGHTEFEENFTKFIKLIDIIQKCQYFI